MPDCVRVQVRAVDASVVAARAWELCRAVGPPPDGTYVVEVAVDSRGLPYGVTTGSVRLATNLDRFRSIDIPFQVRVVPALVVTPDLLFLGEVDAARPKEARVRMGLADGAPFRIVAVSSSVSGLECIHDEGFGSEAELRCRLSGARRAPGPVEGLASVSFVRQGRSVVETRHVPVYGYGSAGVAVPAAVEH